jgi:hypothetical protein
VRAGVLDTIAMKMTGHKTRSVFDRYDITSKEDLAEAARKLQMLAGTISGTIAPPTVAPKQKRCKSLNVLSGPDLSQMEPTDELDAPDRGLPASRVERLLNGNPLLGQR